MSATSSELRLVELLPGGDRITSGPLRIVAALDDRGNILTHFRGSPTPADLSQTLGAAIAGSVITAALIAVIVGGALLGWWS